MWKQSHHPGVNSRQTPTTSIKPPTKMPRGRPKITVPPCRHCGRQFKRQEHLNRHERTHTAEKPFPCDCGQRFSRQDLLARHVKLAHASTAEIAPPPRPGADADEQPDISSSSQMNLFGDIDFIWDADFMTQDILPISLLGCALPLPDIPQTSQAPQMASFSRFSSRLPLPTTDLADDAEGHLQDTPRHGVENRGILAVDECSHVPWSIASSSYDTLCRDVLSYSDILPTGCTLPSRNALTRNLESFFRCVQEHLPFIHSRTFSVETKDVELTLAVAAFGSLYRFETAKAYELYVMSKAILFERIRQRDVQKASELLSGQLIAIPNETSPLSRIQTFVVLIWFASWTKKAILSDALAMSSQLATLVRQNGISEADEMPQSVDWPSWIAAEERRRTLFAAFVLFNLHSIAFDNPPLILNDEVGVFLPGSSEQWKATNSFQWQCSTRHSEQQFRVVLGTLHNRPRTCREESLSSFANYLLIHGLLQHIYMDRHRPMRPLESDRFQSFEVALRNWQSSWELTDDSTLDPLSSKGPLALNAAAILRLAYVRLNVDLDLYQGLFTGDFRYIQEKTVRPTRSPHTDVAVLHAAHALSIPVRLGVELVARTRLPMKSIEHSLDLNGYDRFAAV
ncbi:hypothetical protein B0T10DRAFT_596400 [Thelonectria olida]|uniref:C2H2-type domain-containing protein n=1 Tax=Thelonectria olida TaxID=1576542 RepID=A0A9P8W7I2_9HYPO|nr:hypothetical protein B0T10DRAFT_596400 [Thelonectria olida]